MRATEMAVPRAGVARVAAARRRGRRAFTLIELLVVTAILGVVVGVIGACLAGGIRVWESARRFNAVESDALLALEVIERDLVNSLDVAAIPFSGTEQTLAFALLLPEAEAGAPRRLGSVRYSYLAGESLLVRESAPFPEPDARRESLLAGVARLTFAYARQGAGAAGGWAAPAPSATSMPDRVVVSLGVRDGDEQLAFRRDVLLPVQGAARSEGARR